MVYVLYFSPNGTTLRTLNNIVGGMDTAPTSIDLNAMEKQRAAMEKANVNYVYQSVYEITYSFLKKSWVWNRLHPKKKSSYDIFNHICEQYFSGEDDNTSDYMAEALMKSSDRC